ncbi:MAG TPA: class I SAM-dependent methyltransferase, partial [Terracidiphilus sp.]|nr:class I SAM-dependent methyltransferase [Terracidiphilus sp.]
TLCFRTRDRHYGIPGEFNVIRCSGCGLVRQNPIPTLEELGSFYGDDYYAYQPARKDGWLKTTAKKLLRTTIKTHNPKVATPGEFLDMGCGSGEYLHMMLAQGWKVRGVEPNACGAEEGRRSGLNIFNGTLLDARFPAESFDYVRANHSFEHVPNPVEVMNEVYRILKPGGRLYIGVPNIDSVPYRIFGKYWWHLGIPVHTYNYSVTTISNLIRQSGFAIDKVYFNSNFASLLGSLQIYLNRKNGRKSTEGWLMKNPVLMFGTNILTYMLDVIRQGDTVEVLAHK